MTDEELDRARGIEARRRAISAGLRGGPCRGDDPEALVAVSEIAARLAREGWTPEDPLLKEARDIIRAKCSIFPESYMGEGTREMQIALAALRRGIELAAESAPKRPFKPTKVYRHPDMQNGWIISE